jgi:hypothetical protein
LVHVFGATVDFNIIIVVLDENEDVAKQSDQEQDAETKEIELPVA